MVFVYPLLVEPTPRPTEAELEILAVLWRDGPSTVRHVHAEVERSRGQKMAYTTVLKLLQIMTEKRIVQREESARAHIFRPALPQEQTQRRLLANLRDKAFGGSAVGLVMQALSDKPASADEIREIRELLDRFERGEK